LFQAELEEPLKAHKGARKIVQHPFKEKKEERKGIKHKGGKPEEDQKPARKRRKKAPSSTTGSDSGLATSPAREVSPEYEEVCGSFWSNIEWSHHCHCSHFG
jgi:hypothetical protein